MNRTLKLVTVNPFLTTPSSIAKECHFLIATQEPLPQYGDGAVLAGSIAGVPLSVLESEAEELKAEIDAIVAEARKQVR